MHNTPNGLANMEFGRFGFQLNFELTYRLMTANECLWGTPVGVLQGLVYAGGYGFYMLCCACNDMVIAHYVIIEQNHHIQYVLP